MGCNAMSQNGLRCNKQEHLPEVKTPKHVGHWVAAFEGTQIVSLSGSIEKATSPFCDNKIQ